MFIDEEYREVQISGISKTSIETTHIKNTDFHFCDFPGTQILHCDNALFRRCNFNGLILEYQNTLLVKPTSFVECRFDFLSVSITHFLFESPHKKLRFSGGYCNKLYIKYYPLANEIEEMRDAINVAMYLRDKDKLGDLHVENFCIDAGLEGGKFLFGGDGKSLKNIVV